LTATPMILGPLTASLTSEATASILMGTGQAQ
jgi:hypothetical protein